jgi:hypothetical protein
MITERKRDMKIHPFLKCRYFQFLACRLSVASYFSLFGMDISYFLSFRVQIPAYKCAAYWKTDSYKLPDTIYDRLSLICVGKFIRQMTIQLNKNLYIWGKFIIYPINAQVKPISL